MNLGRFLGVTLDTYQDTFKIHQNTCILTVLHVFYTYLKRVQDTCRIHIRYIRIHVSYALPWCHTATLDTYQDTSGYMYLGLFIKIHQDTQRYKITIHVSWTRHNDTSGYNQDTSWYMYLGRFVRAALDTHKIRSRYTAYIQDTYPWLVLSALLPKELKSLRLFVAGVGVQTWGSRWRAGTGAFRGFPMSRVPRSPIEF